MSQTHLVRVGTLGQIGRFRSLDALRYPRGSEVVVRTGRGLEIGQVLSRPEFPKADHQPEGAILRRLTEQDRLLQTRLQRNRHEAFQACAALIRRRGLNATLVDVEQLFDGQKLFFYFLGEVDPAVETLSAELAEAYEAKAQLARFAETLAAGCGPDCGTEAGGGCGTGGCAGCAVADACGTRRR